jgi:hypothetical protein
VNARVNAAPVPGPAPVVIAIAFLLDMFKAELGVVVASHNIRKRKKKIENIKRRACNTSEVRFGESGLSTGISKRLSTERG